MRVLALDLGTKLGWAVASPNTIIGGTIDLTPRRFDGGGMRYLRFREKLQTLLIDITQVAFEEVRRHMGVDAAHVYGGMMAVLTEECERRGIPYEGIPVGTIKKHATGKGNAAKALMIEAAVQRWPHVDIADDNQADAMHLADFVVERRGS